MPDVKTVTMPILSGLLGGNTKYIWLSASPVVIEIELADPRAGIMTGKGVGRSSRGLPGSVRRDPEGALFPFAMRRVDLEPRSGPWMQDRCGDFAISALCERPLCALQYCGGIQIVHNHKAR